MKKGSDKDSVTHGQTDGRTDVHTRREEQYMYIIYIPQGETY